jgi:hypothetical protein
MLTKENNLQSNARIKVPNTGSWHWCMPLLNILCCCVQICATNYDRSRRFLHRPERARGSACVCARACVRACFCVCVGVCLRVCISRWLSVLQIQSIVIIQILRQFHTTCSTSHKSSSYRFRNMKYSFRNNFLGTFSNSWMCSLAKLLLMIERSLRIFCQCCRESFYEIRRN